MRQRNRGRVYSVVIDEFEKSGISQTDLASRLHKGTDQISRWLGSPGNWTLDTVSDLFFAISGGELAYGVQYPLDLPATNQTGPDWMTPVTYCGTFPHNSQYISGAASYAVTSGINSQVTGQTPTLVEFGYSTTAVTGQIVQDGSLLAVSTGSAHLAGSTVSGSVSVNTSSSDGSYFNFSANDGVRSGFVFGSPVPITNIPLAR
jgi:hypothetical protein